MVDALIEQVIAAPDRASLVARAHALDRVLQWGFYVIPNWHIAYDRVAYWDKFGRPPSSPTQGVQFDTWWFDPAKAAALAATREEKTSPRRHGDASARPDDARTPSRSVSPCLRGEASQPCPPTSSAACC